MKKLSIRNAVVNAIEEMDESTSRYQNQMLVWAKYIEREIGSALAHSFKAKAAIVNNCLIDIPIDCYRVHGLVPGNNEDQCNLRYRNLNEPIIQEDTRIIEDNGTREIDTVYLWIPLNTTWIQFMLWEEIGEYISLVRNYDGQQVTIIYQKIDLDKNGYWLVNESHLDAIKKYIIYMTAKKFGWREFKSNKMLRANTLAYIHDLKNDYNIAVRNARANDGRESPFEKSQY